MGKPCFRSVAWSAGSHLGLCRYAGQSQRSLAWCSIHLAGPVPSLVVATIPTYSLLRILFLKVSVVSDRQLWSQSKNTKQTHSQNNLPIIFLFSRETLIHRVRSSTCSIDPPGIRTQRKKRGPVPPVFNTGPLERPVVRQPVEAGRSLSPPS